MKSRRSFRKKISRNSSKKKKTNMSCLERYADHEPTDEECQVYEDMVEASEGFDVDYYAPVHTKVVGLIIPVGAAEIEECIEEYKHFMEMGSAEACKVYGQELEDEKIIKATLQGGPPTMDYFITFTAKACLDGVTRVYQAKINRFYDFSAPDDCKMEEDEVEFVRLKPGEPPHAVASCTTTE